jgi:hypothetical protein
VTDGVNALPKALAAGLRVERETRVARLATDGARLRLSTEDGAEHVAATVVMTCPVPQTLELLSPLAVEAGEELRGVLALLERVHMVASLVVMAGYERPTATDWHLRLPGAESVIHSLINDSSKRGQGARQVLVIQGRPGYSRREIDGEQEQWSKALLEAAARELGQWVLAPAWVQRHRWRHARVVRGDELGHPVLLRLSGGATLGLCGEAFNPRGGAEGAYLSGLELAERLLSGTATPNGIQE